MQIKVRVFINQHGEWTAHGWGNVDGSHSSEEILYDMADGYKGGAEKFYDIVADVEPPQHEIVVAEVHGAARPSDEGGDRG